MNKTAATILILVSIGIFYTYISPQYGAAQELSARVAEYRDVVDNVARIADARANLTTVYESIPAAEKERIAKALPSSIDAVGFALDLDTIAAKYGISVKSVQVDTAADPNAPAALPQGTRPYEKAKVSFSIISTYANFTKFLADLERSLRIVEVKSINFKATDTGLYEHQVVVETYWLK